MNPAAPATRIRKTAAIKYLALGDSYTIGTGASVQSRSFPSLLAARLESATGREVELVNPAVNGFTTQDLLREELLHLASTKPDLVSVLIGVNDLVQGRHPEHYQRSLVEIYDAVATLQPADGNVVGVSIPNWSAVPAARDFGDPSTIRMLTDQFNAIARGEAVRRHFTWVDIGEVSTSGMGSNGWIASDRLHPGDAQYAAWSEVIWAAVQEAWTRVRP